MPGKPDVVATSRIEVDFGGNLRPGITWTTQAGMWRRSHRQKGIQCEE